jgi:hypothetical protein
MSGVGRNGARGRDVRERGELDPPAGDGLLGNMSSRPRTEIRRDVPAVQQGWVLFDLTDVWRAYTSETQPDVLTPEQLARLDARWQTLGLRGATLVIRSRVAPLGLEPLVCRDEELTLNVLLRVRGNLLVHGMPLLDRRDPLASNALLCPHPRLHEHVLAVTDPVRGQYPRQPVQQTLQLTATSTPTATPTPTPTPTPTATPTPRRSHP